MRCEASPREPGEPAAAATGAAGEAANLAGLLVATRAGRIAPVSREMIIDYVAMHSLRPPKSY